MSKTIQEQIEVMQHFVNGRYWDWYSKDYRIKEKKQTITIEKWLVQFDDEEYRIIHSSDISKSSATKVKLLDTYEVGL